MRCPSGIFSLLVKSHYGVFVFVLHLLPWKSMESLQERHLCCFAAEKLQCLLGPGVQIVHLPLLHPQWRNFAKR